MQAPQNNSLKPPHGLMGPELTEPSYLMPTLLAVAAVLLGALLYWWLRRARLGPKKAPALSKEAMIGLHRQQVAGLNFSAESAINDAGVLSLAMRQAMEGLIGLSLSDMTFEEIQSVLPSRWPLTSHQEDFMELLQSCDRLLYQRQGGAVNEGPQLRTMGLRILDELVKYARQAS